MTNLFDVVIWSETESESTSKQTRNAGNLYCSKYSHYVYTGVGLVECGREEKIWKKNSCVIFFYLICGLWRKSNANSSLMSVSSRIAAASLYDIYSLWHFFFLRQTLYRISVENDKLNTILCITLPKMSITNLQCHIIFCWYSDFISKSDVFSTRLGILLLLWYSLPNYYQSELSYLRGCEIHYSDFRTSLISTNKNFLSFFFSLATRSQSGALIIFCLIAL